MSLYQVTAWEVHTDTFNGLVYTQKIALDLLQAKGGGTMEIKFLYRDHEPKTPGMTYRLIEE